MGAGTDFLDMGPALRLDAKRREAHAWKDPALDNVLTADLIAYAGLRNSPLRTALSPASRVIVIWTSPVMAQTK